MKIKENTMIRISRVLNGEVKRTEGPAGTEEEADNLLESDRVLKISQL